MNIPIFSAAALGLALFSAAPDGSIVKDRADGVAGLIGARLYASETPIPRWGDPVRAEDVMLEDLGRIESIVDGSGGSGGHVIVAVGGLWGLGAQEVEVGMERLRLLPAAGGETRLVVDLSAEGAEPIPG